jgi:3',5'-nucleoside bisphosphate phosphatase
MRADLHIHSRASDGTLTPSALVDLAARNHVDVIALADHDSVSGVPSAVEAGARLGVKVIPAVELSAAVGDRSIHILGYFVDVHDTQFMSRLEELRVARVQRAADIVSALQAAGYQVSLDTVLALSDGGAVGRTHVARTLVAAGHAQDVSDAFERLVGRGRPFYRSKAQMEPKVAIELIVASGGIAVLAQPGVSGTQDLIEELVGDGLSGVEAYHVDHTQQQRIDLVGIADGLGLLKTGGTDYHSPDAPHPDLGDVDYPEQDLREFLAVSASRQV